MFFSVTTSTTLEEIENTLTFLKGVDILEVEDKEVHISKFKMISKLSFFVMPKM